MVLRRAGWLTALLLGTVLLAALAAAPRAQEAPPGELQVPPPVAVPTEGNPTAERIVAVVENQPILLSEVQGRLAVELEQRNIDPGDSVTVRQLRDLILENLIEQRVLDIYGKDSGFTVSDEEVSQAVADAIERNKQALGSEQMFRLQLQREGITEEELRQRFTDEARRQLLAERVVQSELGAPPEVTPQEVRQYFDEHRSELPKREESVELQRIVILVKPDSSLIGRSRKMAADVAAKIRAGDLGFVEAAKRYSDDPNTRSTGGDLHRLQRGDLAGSLGQAFEDQIFSLEPGQVSEPIQSPLGFHLFMVQERNPEEQWIRASHILFSVPVVRADEVRAEDIADAVHDSLAAGADFAEMARRYSDAPEGAEGGTVGWVPWQMLDGDLQKALADLKPGEVSPVVHLEGGFMIARVLGREAERPYAFDEIASELTDHVREVRMEDRYRTWMDDLKQKYFVERRPWE